MRGPKGVMTKFREKVIFVVEGLNGEPPKRQERQEDGVRDSKSRRKVFLEPAEILPFVPVIYRLLPIECTFRIWL